MIVSEKKIDRLVQKMHEYYSNEDSNTLATVDFPKKLEYKSNEWLINIFYSCLLDYGMRSQNYHNNLINTYHLYPQIFNPKYVKENYTTNKDELLSIMKNNIHPRYPNVALDKWLNLSIEWLIYEANVCKFNDKLGYIPLDRHDIEISYLNNIIDDRKLNNNQIEELSRLYIKNGEKLGIDANLIDKYLWNIGNDFCNKKKCTKRPLYDDCKTKEDS